MRDTQYPSTIKTSPPSLEGVIERPRLLEALADLQAPAKWLQAPSGTGKSTLAAHYAQASGKTLAWYRLDERDNDPAFFFGEFARTVETHLALAKPLPKFVSDDNGRLQEFARRLATALNSQLKTLALLVFDDVQHLTSDEMQAALAALVAVSVDDSETLFVSQSSAPTAFFDAIAARHLSLLNDADLSFTNDECKAMTAALRIADTHAEDIAALTGGHAGALILACELLRGNDPGSALGVATVERIHLHLLGNLVDRMPAPRRELLTQTAFVAQITRSIAEDLAGADAALEIDALVDSSLLRRVGSVSEDMFEAHGLVRQGMQTLVRARTGYTEVRALAERTAAVLSANDQHEAAFALLAEIGSTARAIEELRSLAERYAKLGQSDLLLSSIAKLPSADVDRDAWLCFWTGQALLRVDEEQARLWFERSYAAFQVQEDRYGMRLAAASNVIAFQLECGDLRELDAWVDRHEEVGGDTPVTPGDRFEATLIMGIICAAFARSRYPSVIDPDALTARLQYLIESQHGWLSQDQRVQGARLLIEHCDSLSKFERGATVIIATRSLIDEAVGGVLHRGRWLIAAANFYASSSAAEAAVCLHEARSLTTKFEASRLSFELGFASANYWMKAQDFSRAADELSALQQVATKAPPAQRAEYAKLMTRLLLLQGRLVEGLQWAEEAMRIAVPAGFTGPNLRAFEMECVYALAANGRLADAIVLVGRSQSDPIEFDSAVKYCLRFLDEGERDLRLLSEGLRNAAQIGFINLLDRARGPLARVCAAALAHDIETEFINRVIKLKKLKPPPFAGPHWPWPVKVRTLGGFRLDVQLKRYQPTHKAQDKPLELLKLLVTCQALGRAAADKTWISERLWPEAAPENARKSLDMTISRLRRLLGDEATIVANEGRLQLSPDHVWTDIQLLRYALSQAQTRRDEKAAGSNVVMTEAAATVRSVLELYEGPYLQDEDGPPWLLAGREAIATAVRQALITADLILDGSVDELLIPGLEKALLADPASEDLARSLMRALLRQARHSEAIQVYRRLRQMLSLLLGVAPSPETDHIRDRAYAAQSSQAASHS